MATKKELMSLLLTDTELKNCDVANPDSFRNALRELQLSEFLIRNFVWSYVSNKVAGRPINLLERFYHIYQEAPRVFDICKEIVSNGILDSDIDELTSILKRSDYHRLLFESEMRHRIKNQEESEKHEDITEQEYNAILEDFVASEPVQQLMSDPVIAERMRKKYNSKVIQKWKDMEGKK